MALVSGVNHGAGCIGNVRRRETPYDVRTPWRGGQQRGGRADEGVPVSPPCHISVAACDCLPCRPSAAGREEEFGEDDEDDELAGLGRGGQVYATVVMTSTAGAGYEKAEFDASKSTDKKVDWIKQTGCTDKEKVCTDGKLEVVGAGEILVAKAKALPSKDSAWATASCAATKSCRPERKAMMGNTSDTKPFWAASFVGNLQIATNTKGSAIRLGFIKMSMCKVRSSSNGCADSTELEDAAATQEFEEQQSTRRLLDSQSSGDSTCCTIKKMIHHCATRKDWSASFKECDVGGKVLAGMMV